MDRNLIFMLVGVAILLGGAFVLAGGKSETNNLASGDPFEITEVDHVKGEGTGGVTLIEYADFECPACATFTPQLGQLQAEFGEEVRIVYRHFPLTSIHPNATAAHRASIAAGNQGAFWEMHDLLYEDQFRWARQFSNLDVAGAINLFESYAETLGLDMEQYRTDVSSEDTSALITRGQELGNAVDVQGTPTIFINGERIQTPASYEELQIQVAAALDEAANTTADTEAEPAPAN